MMCFTVCPAVCGLYDVFHCLSCSLVDYMIMRCVLYFVQSLVDGEGLLGESPYIGKGRFKQNELAKQKAIKSAKPSPVRYGHVGEPDKSKFLVWIKSISQSFLL